MRAWVIRFVARTIRFIVMTAIVHRSDARTKRQFNRQSGLGTKISRAQNEAVDNARVQTQPCVYPLSPSRSG
jgi:hypothetical protein